MDKMSTERHGGTIRFDEQGAAIDPPGPVEYGVYRAQRVQGKAMLLTDEVTLHLRVDGWYWLDGRPFCIGPDGIIREATRIGDLPEQSGVAA